MLNIVIPMAGAGSRFSSAGYDIPKPLIPINGTPMIEIVINNLRPTQDHRFIFICQHEHVEKYGLTSKLQQWAPGCLIVELNVLTEGAACTVLAAKSFINSVNPLMIANSDQFIDININNYLEKISAGQCDGLIMTMKATDPKWSFVDVNNSGYVTRVEEKNVISDEATVGIYNFIKGSDFVTAAESMIDANQRINGEFYVAPVYNNLIYRNKKIRIYNIGSLGCGMHGLGTPDDLNNFILHCKSKDNNL